MRHQVIGSNPIWNRTSLDQHTFLQCKFDTYIIELGGIVLQKVNEILKAIDFNNQLSNKMQSKTWIIYEAYKTSNVLFLMMHKGFTIGEWREKMEHIIG
jgi:hypothetical protein